ncbi:hypothetical protein [Natronosalvus halobius]|uniref:hypothetical protein n=1 Tax=Natronosalvus halobius TaxID=2953746 RepID=UPI00209DAD78|nr:hypothetical protein [Natronosalvus halobius]USZ70772.1 hypothetical protein NGM15_11755 [Natronosalvus halobius]
MVSRENRVILGSFVLFVATIGLLIGLEAVLDVGPLDSPLLTFLLFSGFVVVLPQLYLAITDDEVSPRARVRFAVIATLVFAAMIGGDAAGWQRWAILVVAGGTFVILVGHEFWAGYRTSSETSSSATRVERSR